MRGAVEEEVPTMRRSRWSAVLAVGAVSLAGCGGVGSSDSSDDGASGAPASLSTFGFGLPDEIATVRVKAFESSPGGVPVKVTEGGFDEQQFLSAVASGTPPDAVHLDRALVGTYAARGAIQPMDQCITDESIDMSQYRKVGVDQVTLDGKVYGIPEFNGVRVVISGDRVVEAAGLTQQEVASGDWATLTKVNDAMTKGKGRSLQTIGYDPRIPEALPLWVAANGGSMLSDDGKTATLTDPKVVEALEFTASLVLRAGSNAEYKAFRESTDFFGAGNQYAKDQIGAMPIDDFYLNVLADLSPDAGFSVSPFRDRSGKEINVAGGSAWAIPKGSKNPDEACRFAKVMTATDTWVAAATARAKTVRAEGGVYTGTRTGNVAADEKIFTEVFEPTGNPALDEGVKVLDDAQETAIALPASPAGGEFDQAYKDAVTRVLDGEQTPQQALEQAQAEAQKALDAAVAGAK